MIKLCNSGIEQNLVNLIYHFVFLTFYLICNLYFVVISASAIPAGTGQIASCHPLLVRHANHASVTDSSAHGSVVPRSQSNNIGHSGTGSADGWSHRVMRAGFNLGAMGSRLSGATVAGQSDPSANHTIHLSYNGNRQPRNPPMVLQRCVFSNLRIFIILFLSIIILFLCA